MALLNARADLPFYTSDQRLITVVGDALDFAISHPEEITLTASRGRNSYKGHTPNMVAFSSMMQAAHNFAAATKSRPVAFYHDEQTEFGKTTREYAELFAKLRLHQAPVTRSWARSDVEVTEYDLGRFSMPSSKDNAPLQTVDIFLWVLQRDGDLVADLRSQIFEKVHLFGISRAISESVCLEGAARKIVALAGLHLNRR